MTGVSRRDVLAGTAGAAQCSAGQNRRLLVPLTVLIVILERRHAGERRPLRPAARLRQGHLTVDDRDDRQSTGLVADNITGDLATPSTYTSPTNIGGYLWSAVVARELGIISGSEARHRVAQTLDTLAGLNHHTASGMFYN
jgi:hypothetical protein